MVCVLYEIQSSIFRIPISDFRFPISDFRCFMFVFSLFCDCLKSFSVYIFVAIYNNTKKEYKGDTHCKFDSEFHTEPFIREKLMIFTLFIEA